MIKKVFSKHYDRKVWAFDIRVNGRRYRQIGFESEDQAQEAAVNLRRSALNSRFGVELGRRSVTLKALIDARIKGHSKSVASPKSLELALTRFLESVPDLRVDQLTGADITRYVNDRIASGAAPGTVNRELADIRACFRSAGEYFSQLERWKPPRIKRLKEPPGRDRIIRLEEFNRLIERLRRPRLEDEQLNEWQACQHLADIFIIGALTGMRRGEVMNLRWTSVNWEWNKLKVQQTKTKKALQIDMAESVREILLRRKKEFGHSEWIFPGKKGKYTYPIYTLRRICKELGLPYGRKVEGGFIFHDERHSFVSRMLELGVDLATIQNFTGHSDKAMTLRYGHSTPAQTRDAISKLDDVHSNSAAKPEKKKEVG